MKKSNQQGFSAIEGLLILIVILMIGFIGYYVYHSQQQANKTLNAAQADNNSTTSAKKSTSSSSSSSATKYFTISQWGVRAPYDGTDSFTPNFSPDSSSTTEIVSANLSKTYDCSTFGAGEVTRASSGDPSNDPANPTVTVGEDYSSNPSFYAKVGSYYYYFSHDKAACSDSVTADAQNAANDAVKALVPNLQATPQ